MVFNQHSQSGHFGFSLVEMAMVLVFISLAMVPIVSMINGQTSTEGNVTRVSAIKSKSALFANSILESALTGDYTGQFGINCGNNVIWPTDGSPNQTYNCNNIGPYNTPMSYQWNLRLVSGNNASNAEEIIQGNKLYVASLNVYESATAGGAPVLTLPTYLMQDIGGDTISSESTGMVLALDTSGSMAWPETNNAISPTQGVSSPFMRYRYSNYAPVAANVPVNLQLNMWDNSQLDLVYAQSTQTPADDDPEPFTAFNEAYPYAAGPANNMGYPFTPPLNCTDPTVDLRGTEFEWIFHRNNIRGNNSSNQNNIADLCRAKASQADWENVVNANLSRIEASRTGAISLLLEMESDPDIASNIDMGFISWSGSAITTEVNMESSVPMMGLGERFPNMRQRLLWINRYDMNAGGNIMNGGNNIGPGGGTPMDLALRRAVDVVRDSAARDYGRKIIILLTDGEPSPATGDNTNANLISYANSVGNGEPVESERITIFTIGLIGADPTLMSNIANATPNGQAYVTSDISELKAIFEQIAYQAKRLALLSKGNNYGINFE